jgi:hypothetical protein
MKKNLIKNVLKVTDKYCEKKFNDLVKKLNINIVTLTIRQKDDIKEDQNKTILDINNDLTYKKERCD